MGYEKFKSHQYIVYKGFVLLILIINSSRHFGIKFPMSIQIFCKFENNQSDISIIQINQSARTWKPANQQAVCSTVPEAAVAAVAVAVAVVVGGGGGDSTALVTDFLLEL